MTRQHEIHRQQTEEEELKQRIRFYGDKLALANLSTPRRFTMKWSRSLHKAKAKLAKLRRPDITWSIPL